MRCCLAGATAALRRPTAARTIGVQPVCPHRWQVLGLRWSARSQVVGRRTTPSSAAYGRSCVWAPPTPSRGTSQNGTSRIQGNETTRSRDLPDSPARRSPCLIYPSPILVSHNNVTRRLLRVSQNTIGTPGPAHLHLGQPVGHHRRSDAVELEDLRVALLDDDQAARRRAARAADRANRQAERIAQGEGAPSGSGFGQALGG
jgi:hypothetical protein